MVRLSKVERPRTGSKLAAKRALAMPGILEAIIRPGMRYRSSSLLSFRLVSRAFREVSDRCILSEIRISADTLWRGEGDCAVNQLVLNNPSTAITRVRSLKAHNYAGAGTRRVYTRSKPLRILSFDHVLLCRNITELHAGSDFSHGLVYAIRMSKGGNLNLSHAIFPQLAKLSLEDVDPFDDLVLFISALPTLEHFSYKYNMVDAWSAAFEFIRKALAHVPHRLVSLGLDMSPADAIAKLDVEAYSTVKELWSQLPALQKLRLHIATDASEIFDALPNRLASLELGMAQSTVKTALDRIVEGDTFAGLRTAPRLDTWDTKSLPGAAITADLVQQAADRWFLRTDNYVPREIFWSWTFCTIEYREKHRGAFPKAAFRL